MEKIIGELDKLLDKIRKKDYGITPSKIFSGSKVYSIEEFKKLLKKNENQKFLKKKETVELTLDGKTIKIPKEDADEIKKILY